MTAPTHAAAYWPLFALVTALALLLSAFSIGMGYVDGRLDLHWRKWLTTYLVDRYLQRRTYYEITLDESIDNPDQRIQEETAPFCNTIATLPRLLFSSLLNMTVQAAILISISSTLFWSVFGFAAFQAIVMMRLYKPTIKQNFEITVAEADLRYGILHVRDHAETVAFYGGEAAERQHILERLNSAVHKKLINMIYLLWMRFTSTGLGVLWKMIPIACLVPVYFRGHFQYGSIAQATVAAGELLAALGIVVDFLPLLTAAAPRVVRLAQIQEKFDAMASAWETRDAASHIALHTGASIVLEHVSLQTPGGEHTLVRDLSFAVAAGRHLVIVGQTGVGKSSLLRAMAGLWTRGGGDITMPPRDDMLFLPQRPYMILANLRAQLLYPSARVDLSDAELQIVLERVSLGHLAERHGGFDAIKDWGRTLSLGEQQRIAFARVLIARPRFVFLDEATSAVDVPTEQLLYGLLRRSRVTFVSVGHRPSLLDYHIEALQLLPGGGWRIVPAAAAMEVVGEPDSMGTPTSPSASACAALCTVGMPATNAGLRRIV